MVNKLTDNISKGGNVKKNLISTKMRLMWRLKSDDLKSKFGNTLRERIQKLKKELRKDHQHQLREIRMNRKKEEKLSLPKELNRYKSARIFSGTARREFRPGTIIGPVQIVFGSTSAGRG